MALQVVLVALLMAGAVVKAADFRATTGTARVFVAHLAAGLFALGVGQVLSFPPVTQTLDSASAGLGKLAYNALTVLGLCAVLSFFTEISRPVARIRAGLWRNWVTGIAVVLLLTLLMWATPPEHRSHTLTSPYLGDPTVTAFYVLGGIYFIYVFLLSGVATRRVAAQSRGALASALHIISAGLLVLVVASVVRTGRVVEVAVAGDPLLWLNTATFWLNNLGYILVTVGLSLAGVAQAIATWRWWQQRRKQYEALAPLWSLLTAAFPEIALDEHRNSRLPRASQHRHRFRRRVIEIRDGLLRLSPFLIDETADQGTLGGADPEATAAQLRNVLRSQTALTNQPRSPRQPPVIVGVDDDIETLVAISRAL